MGGAGRRSALATSRSGGHHAVRNSGRLILNAKVPVPRLSMCVQDGLEVVENRRLRQHVAWVERSDTWERMPWVSLRSTQATNCRCNSEQPAGAPSRGAGPRKALAPGNTIWGIAFRKSRPPNSRCESPHAAPANGRAGRLCARRASGLRARRLATARGLCRWRL